MNLMRSLKYRNLLIIVLLIVTAAVTAIFVWPIPKQEQNSLTTFTQTLETYSLDTSSNPPRWIKTLETTETIKRDPRDMPQREGHTTKIILPGSKVAFIELNGATVKPNTPTSLLFKVTGNGGAVPANTYLIIDKVNINGLHAVKMVFKTSEFVNLILNNLKSDGALLDYVPNQNVPSYPPYNEQTWDGLPGLTLSNIRTDEIVIEVTGANATIGELRFINIRVPGEVLVERLKGNEFKLDNSTFGEGDGIGTTDTFIIEATVMVNSATTPNMKQNETIDNR